MRWRLLKGGLRRNLQGYTTDRAQTLLGLGATSIGRTLDRYVQNIAETGAWARSVEAGTLPVGRGHALTRDDRMRACVIEALMCHGRVDLDEAAILFESSPDGSVYADRDLPQLETDGVIRRDGPMICVTGQAASWVRIVAALFDAYLETGSSRHSVAA
ncbi:MAG: hypothetical protein AAF501_01935 [Pseudomonadota bacterium]